MKFHVVGLPHTQTTADYSCCAYTGKIIRFCAMMRSLGHTVYLYAASENEASCNELIVCATHPLSPEDYCSPAAAFDPSLPPWRAMNAAAIAGIRKRARPTDFICLIAGVCQKQIADAFPHMLSVEFGIGYGGVFARYKIFESAIWQHTVYGQQHGACQADGNFYDTVIPNYFDPADFDFRATKDDYYLFIGRLTRRKGPDIAVEMCRRLGARLVVAGPPGDWRPPRDCEYVGPVGVAERSRLMSGARAALVPTLYLEPFGGVSVEARLCGTPVICTPWGAFVEHVTPGVDGFLCHNLDEWCEAAHQIDNLDPQRIRDMAVSRFSMDVVRHQYERYFQRLLTLWGDGWYSRKQDAQMLALRTECPPADSLIA